MSTSVINLLSKTLQPHLQHATSIDLERARSIKGFATELMVIADDCSQNISIRQSALVVLKNMVFDECTKGGVIDEEDWNIIKSNILQFLTRIWGNKQLTNVLR